MHACSNILICLSVTECDDEVPLSSKGAETAGAVDSLINSEANSVAVLRAESMAASVSSGDSGSGSYVLWDRVTALWG